MPLPPLNAVRTFEVAARHLSYTKAAQELCVTPGAVSRAIASLEQRLQVPLFKQHRRQLQLTAAGQNYCFQVSQVLNKLSAATDELQQYRGEGGLLVIGVLPTLGERWLIPKLAEFQKEYPAISLELKMLPSDFSKSFTELDLETCDVDIAVYVGQEKWTGVVCEPLFQEQLIPVASPLLADALSRMAEGDEAAQRQLLLHTTRPRVWHAWFKQQGIHFNPYWYNRFEHYFMVIEAAVSGMGIALLPKILIQSELEQERLIGLYDAVLPQEQQYLLLYNAIRQDEKRINIFTQWLRSNTQ